MSQDCPPNCKAPAICLSFWKRRLSWARRKAIVSPGDAVPQIYQQRLQYLLPLCLTDMETPDLAITLRPMDGYYMGYTCLTLEMAYLNARLLARPTAKWLLDLVE